MEKKYGAGARGKGGVKILGEYDLYFLDFHPLERVDLPNLAVSDFLPLALALLESSSLIPHFGVLETQGTSLLLSQSDSSNNCCYS